MVSKEKRIEKIDNILSEMVSECFERINNVTGRMDGIEKRIRAVEEKTQNPFKWKYIKITEAKEELGMSAHQLRKLIEDRELKGYYIKGLESATYVEKSECEKLIKPADGE